MASLDKAKACLAHSKGLGGAGDLWSLFDSPDIATAGGPIGGVIGEENDLVARLGSGGVVNIPVEVDLAVGPGAEENPAVLIVGGFLEVAECLSCLLEGVVEETGHV